MATSSTPQIEALISAAQDALRRADLPATIAHYRKVLALDPEHGLANYWLGVLAVKAGMHTEAVRHLEVAVAKHPNLPDIHIDLALAYRDVGMTDQAAVRFRAAREVAPSYAADQLGIARGFERENKIAEAVETCERGLLVFPEDPGLLRTLADLRFRLRQWPEALAHWRTLLQVRADCPLTHFAFGEQCYQVGAFDLAAGAFRRVLELQPGLLNALLNLGLTLQKLGQFRAALECIQQALAIDGSNADIFKVLGDLHRDLHQWTEANSAWAKAVERRPDYVDAWQNLGIGLETQHRLEEALVCHRRVVALRSGDPKARRYLGMILQDLRQLAAAEEQYREGLRLDPNDADTHWQLFSLLASRGEFPKAWEEHEWRWNLKDRTTPKREFKQPRWTGDDLAGRGVLLYSEQGFGDTIQAVRYAPIVQSRGGRVLLWCPPDLVALLRTAAGVSEVFSELSAANRFDCHVPLMSLPLVFGTTVSSIPNRVPYLRVPRDVEFPLPRRAQGGPRVALVWCGSLSQPNDRRPIPFDCLAPLLQLDGVEFFSLQKGRGALSEQGGPMRQRLIDLGPRLSNFAITAAALDQMDLVITIDTAVAHLAGALGKPVWLLLAFASDWRWMLERDDSPWYPTMRLFRQKRPGDWAEVIGRVGHELSNWLRFGGDSPVTSNKASIGARLWSSADPAASIDSRPRHETPSTLADNGIEERRPPERPGSLIQWLKDGLAHHQTGDWKRAEECYRQVLQVEPAQPDALRLLGVLCRQRGDLVAARNWLDKALAIQPADANAQHDLGLVLFDLGLYLDALAALRRSVEIQPEFPDAHYNLGNAYFALKRWAEAEASFLKALEQQPDFALAHYNLGLLAHDRKQFDAALTHYQRAVDLNSANLDALLNLALALKDAGRIDDAETRLRALLEKDPNHPRARVNLASILAAKDDLEPAARLCREVTQACPALAEAWLNWGVVRQAQGDLRGAMDCFRRALELQPDYHDARYNLGIAELLTGLFESGWENYEARWRTSNPVFVARDFPQPLWLGEDLRGRSLLVHAEQGFGDTIQFARYLPLLAERGARIVLECPGPLVRLLSAITGVAQTVSRGDKPPVCDFQVPLLSLPQRTRTTLTNLPRQVPYLRVPVGVSLDLGEARSARLKIGLAWAGNPQHGRDRSRTVPMRQFSPLYSLPGAAFFSLQVGPANREIRQVEPATRIIDLEKHFADFAMTAAAVSQMDLVISVDTAVAHLAGALGKAVWVLVPFAPDWRWLLERDDSPWYPTMRLFRQSRRGDWDSVVDRVNAALQKEFA